ncbi:DUF5996 family protein [Planctomonas deserti]|uniref:DUF5996 family protein n=1 Tax=Planctomonas deserti TaxID=2144185 RepID=UPI00197BD690|nr:DUF5996 family protein [Planctomonas deserti]
MDRLAEVTRTDDMQRTGGVRPRPVLRVADWAETRQTLHMWLQIVGKIRMINATPLNHYWHVTLVVTPRGLSTGHVSDAVGAFDIEFDFVAHELVVRRDDGRAASLPLESMTVSDFFERVRSICASLDIDTRIHAAPNEVDPAVPFAEDRLHSTYMPEHASAFWRQLVDANHALQTFRGGFGGKSSPVHFFWGAMDLAVTRFSGRPAPEHPGGVPNCPDSVMVESYSAELSSAGFWPGGGAEGAYYSYMYPEKPGYREAAVPAGAFYDEQLGEYLLPYETVRLADDPDAVVQQFLTATFEAARAAAEW